MKPTPIRRILVAVDLSPCSRSALALARALADALGASLDALFVTPDAVDASKRALHEFVASSTGAAAAAPGERVETGDARERIVAIAEDDDYDLIVLGTHGRTGRPRSMAGSVAESVVRTASRPVLTVRG